MKQSIGLVILQVLELTVSFISIIYIASNIDPELYAIMGIFVTVTGTIRALSSMGLEFLSIRNILLWSETKQYEKIERLVSQALFSRLVAGFILIPAMVIYVYYISQTKFNGQYFLIFLLFVLSGLIAAFNNSLGLSLISFNRYFLSAFINFLVNVLGKLISLYLFIHHGFIIFLLSICFGTINITMEKKQKKTLNELREKRKTEKREDVVFWLNPFVPAGR